MNQINMCNVFNIDFWYFVTTLEKYLNLYKPVNMLVLHAL